MICPLKYRGRSEPNKYHRGQKCPDEDNWFPRDENKQSHTTTPRTNGGAIASIIRNGQRPGIDRGIHHDGGIANSTGDLMRAIYLYIATGGDTSDREAGLCIERSGHIIRKGVILIGNTGLVI